jgi:hypothetical protein
MVTPLVLKVLDLPGIDISAITISPSFDALFKNENITNVSNIYINLGPEPKGFIQSQEPPPIELTQQNEHEYRSLPFRMGMHFVVNQRSWWEGDQRLAHPTFETVKFVPLKPNKREVISLLGKEPQLSFGVYSTAEGDLEINLPRNEDKQLVSRKIVHLFETKETKWICRRFKPTEYIRLQALDDAVLSFDPEIVRTAWLLERKRRGEYHSQYYVLILTSLT